MSDPSMETLLARRGEFLSFLAARLGSETEAEEVLQAAYVKGLKSLEQVTDESGIVPWFYRVLRSSLIDHMRRKAADARRKEAAAAEGEPLEKDPEMEKAVCQCVKALVPELKPEYRGIVTLVDIEEKPVAAAASELGLTPNNASARLHRARESLKKSLLSTCGACARHGCVDCSCKH